MSDQLVFKVKFEADEKSLNDIKSALDAIEKQRGKKSGDSSKSETEKEASALKELKKELKEKQEQLAKTNKLMSEGNNVTLSMIASQKQLGSEIQSVSQKIQEATRGYVDQNTALSKAPQTLNELIEKQRALKIALSDVDTKSDEFKELTNEYANTTAQIKELKSAMVLGSAEVRQFGTTLADLKLEQKTLATAIENTPIVEQSDRLDKLRKAHQEVTARINEFTKSQQNSSIAQKESTSDSDKNADALSNLRQQLKAKQQDLANLQQALRDGTISSEDMRVKQGELGASIAELRTQVQDATRGYLDQDTVLATTATTYNELVQQNRALSIAMRDIPLDDTTGRLEALQAQYVQNNTKLKEFDASIGNFQRNVGDYASSLRGFANSIAIIQGPLGPIAGRINSLATVIERFTKGKKEATVATTAFGRVMQGNIALFTASTTATTAKTVAVGAMNVGIKGLNFTLKALRLSLMALGIPALVLGVLGIIQAFKGTEEGAQKLRVIMAGLSARLDVFRDMLIGFGNIFIKAFEDPKQAVIDLWEAIKTNIVNRFAAIPKIFISAFETISNGAKAVGLAVKGIWDKDAREASKDLFKQAAKDYVAYIDSIGQVLTGIEDPISRAVEAGRNLAERLDEAKEEGEKFQEAMNAVLVTERELGVLRAEQNRELQRTRALARDMDVDAEIRLEALKEIAREEAKLLDAELENERERLRILEGQMAMSLTSEKTKQAVADQQAKIADLERASLEKQMSAQRDINTTERQIREEQLRRERTRSELFTRNRDLELEKVRDNLIKEGRLTEALQQDLDTIKADSVAEQARLEQLFLTELLAQKFTQEEAERLAKEKADIEVAEQVYKAELALQQQREKDRIGTAKFDRDIALRRQEMLLNFERDRLIMQGRLAEAERLENLHTEEGQLKLLNDLKARYLAEFIEQGIEPEEAARRAREKAELESEQRIVDGRKALNDALAEQRIASARRLQRAIGAINTALFNDNKEIAVANAIVNTYESVTKALASAAPPLSFKLAGLALAEGMANVKKIMSTKAKGSNSTSSASSAPSVSTSFGLVDVGTNPQPFAFNMATGAQSQSSQTMQPNITLAGEFDPAFLAVKVTMGNNEISSQATGI
jgi:hypothetical protein